MSENKVLIESFREYFDRFNISRDVEQKIILFKIMKQNLIDLSDLKQKYRILINHIFTDDFIEFYFPDNSQSFSDPIITIVKNNHQG